MEIIVWTIAGVVGAAAVLAISRAIACCVDA